MTSMIVSTYYVIKPISRTVCAANCGRKLNGSRNALRLGRLNAWQPYDEFMHL